MADPTADTRARAGGSASDRNITKTQAAAAGGVIGAVIGACDWLFLSCIDAHGNFHYVPPPRQLIDVIAPLTALPLVIWLGTVLSIIGDITIRKLRKADGDNT